MNQCELFESLMHANGPAMVREVLVTFEKSYGDQIEWVPVGNRANNVGTIQAAADPGRSLVERITNAVDAVLEYEHDTHNGRPECNSPKEAAAAWLNVPGRGLSEMTAGARRSLAQNIVVTIAEGEEKDSRIVEVKDSGIGISPEEMPSTILSLNESNKIKKHYVAGLFGQGGSSTFAVSEYTLIASKSYDKGRIGFTIVKYQELPAEEYRTGNYVYLTIKGSVLQLDANEANNPRGTIVKHYGYDISNYSSPVGPNSIYGLLNYILFDPILPVWLDDQIHSYRRVIKGSRNALNGAVDEGDETKRGPDIDHAMRMFYVDLGDWGRIGIEYWVLQQPEKRRNPIAAYVNPNKPIILTLNGQSHGEFTRTLIVNDADLPYLSRRLIGHIDCNSLSPAAKRTLFVSNREDARKGFVSELIKDEFIKALRSDDELIRLNIEARNQSFQQKDETAEAQMKSEVAKVLKMQGFDITMATGSVNSINTLKAKIKEHQRQRKRDLAPIEIQEPPTFIRFARESNTISFYPGQRKYIHIETDANGSYHDPSGGLKSSINLIASNGNVSPCGSTPLHSGRMRAVYQCDPNSVIGSRGKLRVELYRKNLQMLSDEKEYEIVEKPPIEIKRKKLTLPPFHIQPVSPDDEEWCNLGFPDEFERDMDKKASVAIKTDGILMIYYSSIYPKYAEIMQKLERKDPGLAQSFQKRYEVWLSVHSLLFENDKNNNEISHSEIDLLNGGEQIERFSENYERMERCRLATISAIIAYNELQNIETEILSLSED